MIPLKWAVGDRCAVRRDDIVHVGTIACLGEGCACVSISEWRNIFCGLDELELVPLASVTTLPAPPDDEGGPRIIAGDNLEVLERLEAEGVVIDLVYLDPPFCTQSMFKMPDERVAFDDRWKDRQQWMIAMAKRLVVIHRMLAPHGSVVIHVDSKTSHLVKVFCDGLFGEDSFASEVVWRYRRWPSATPNFQRVHDVLIRYRKDPNVEPRWNQLYEPLAPSTVATWGTKKQRAIVEDGQRVRSSSTEEESKGVPMGDVWDIGIIAPVAKERTGYPTQKPEALLERVIGSLSNPGDLVLDPYMGSGTTLAVAERMGRRSIGIDSSSVAIEVATARLGQPKKEVA